MAARTVARRDYWRGNESDSDSDDSDDEPEETIAERIKENSKRLYTVSADWSKWGWKKVRHEKFLTNNIELILNCNISI